MCIHICEHTSEEPIEIHFVYAGNKHIYCSFKTCHIMLVLVPSKCHFVVYLIDTVFLQDCCVYCMTVICLFRCLAFLRVEC